MNRWWDQLAVFDTETTGLDTTTERIVTAFIGVIGPDGQLLESHSWLADPGIVIPARATAVHGISTERAQKEGREAQEVVSEIVETLRDILNRSVPVVAFNASYDLSLLHHEARRHGVVPLEAPQPIVDPLVLDRALDPYRRGKRTLDAVSAHYGVINPLAHNAEGDAVTSGRVAQAMAKRFTEVFAEGADTLHRRQIDWSAQWAENFRNFLERNGKASTGVSGEWPVGQIR